MQERVFRAIDESRDRYIRELAELVRLYPRGEEPLQGYIASRMEALGCETEVRKLLPTTAGGIWPHTARGNMKR